MKTITSYPARGSVLPSRAKRVFAPAFLVCLMLCLPEGSRATDCAAVPADPGDATKVDCPAGSPCQPNACTTCPDGVCGAGCGPISTCIIRGSDPPVSQPKWHESGTEGFPAPAGFLSGKCPPPDDSGNIICPTETSGLR